MLFKNLSIENSKVLYDIRVTDGKFDKIGSGIEPMP